MQRIELETYLNQYLEVARFRDYCPNGLQVEGRPEVRIIVTGVTASRDLVEAAIARGADALLVHHGYFWRGEDPRVTGTKRARLGLLLASNLNLFAFHLPLDAHREIGNNAQLARELELPFAGTFGEQELGAHGEFAIPPTVAELAERISTRLQRAPQVIGDPEMRVRRIAWCTGAAQSFLEDAVRLGVDAFVSGEISEQTVHLARESGVAYIAAGHHATERYGIRALGAHLAARFNLEHHFIDIPNPV
ncbi:MAG: Nif3-like dinuclear metal center hexameric protein [Betaproteobacteria bacterium]|nr:Nif3-like dinuclear metal center hexameric protein [Betaproteobacteria bacterium]